MTIPEPLPRGPSKKITNAIVDFIDIRTLQSANLSAPQLAGQMEVDMDTTTMLDVRRRLHEGEPVREICFAALETGAIDILTDQVLTGGVGTNSARDIQ
jgi:hypothetical protein